MTLKELQYIVTIAEEKSISRASARLYVSQPYLSQCLMRIERQHDMPLFRRTQHGLVLTFAGEQYVETARKIVKLYNDFETGLCEISNMRKGRLTIGTTIHLGSMVFSTILPIFRELYPNIELRLEEGPSQKIEEYIIASKVDIGLLHCPLKDSAIPIFRSVKIILWRCCIRAAIWKNSFTKKRRVPIHLSIRSIFRARNLSWHILTRG